jgi:hypothetical protein
MNTYKINELEISNLIKTIEVYKDKKVSLEKNMFYENINHLHSVCNSKTFRYYILFFENKERSNKIEVSCYMINLLWNKNQLKYININGFNNIE